MSNSPNSNAVLGSAVTQMEVDFMEVQNQSEESQDHSTGNGVASMETSGVPSEGMGIFLTQVSFMNWSLQHFTTNRMQWRLMA